MKEKAYFHLNFGIEKFEIILVGKKVTVTKPKKNLILTIQKRPFNFPITNYTKISCESITIGECSFTENLNYKLKSNSKIIMVFIVFLFLWLYIAVFVKTIYQQYGNNVFKICVMPLILMLFVKFLLTDNLMIFISASILYFKGKQFVISKKSSYLLKILFKFLVSSPALTHFNAIMNYKQLTMGF